MAKTTTSKRSSKRDATPNNVNFLTINGLTLALGDLRKRDFSGLVHAKPTVKDNTAVLNQIVDLLRGFTDDANS